LSRLKAMNQPPWSPPTWVRVLIGIAWYGICFTALGRLLGRWPASRTSAALLLALMLANGGVNVLQFRVKRLDLAFFFLLPYWLALAAFLWAVCPLDGLACALFAIYAVYQLYAAAWGYALWRLNRVRDGR
jgi:tryptophan-rich sensory protein